MSAHDHSDGTAGAELATVSGDGRLPERFENPGLPAHRHRLADIDAKAARRAERQVAALFVLSMVGTLIVLVSYFAIKLDSGLAYSDYARRVLTSNFWLGFGLFLALFGIGAGAVHWARTLMPDEERVEYRHAQRGSDEDRASAVAILKEGAGEAGLGRRPLLRTTLLGALALVPLPAVAFLRGTGPLPHKKLAESVWREGVYLVRDPEGGRLRASDIPIGGVAHIMPEDIDKSEHPLEERAKAAVLVMRLDPADLDEASLPGSYEGIVAYSKICTHMGCPVALYEQQTHHLLCPCHQSTFDLRQNCKVIFGPAKRPLPQLAITVDTQGYLVAKRGFAEAPGPSYWERG